MVPFSSNVKYSKGGGASVRASRLKLRRPARGDARHTLAFQTNPPLGGSLPRMIAASIPDRRTGVAPVANFLEPIGNGDRRDAGPTLNGDGRDAGPALNGDRRDACPTLNAHFAPNFLARRRRVGSIRASRLNLRRPARGDARHTLAFQTNPPLGGSLPRMIAASIPDRRTGVAPVSNFLEPIGNGDRRDACPTLNGDGRDADPALNGDRRDACPTLNAHCAPNFLARTRSPGSRDA